MDPLEVQRVAQFIADRVRHKLVPPAVRPVWLGDYVEQVARWVGVG